MTDQTDTTAEETEACSHCGGHHDAPMPDNPVLEALVHRIDDLDEERKMLLLDRLLMSVSVGLRDVVTRDDVPGRLVRDLTVLVNLLNLAGYTGAATTSHHPEWTRTGDKAVDAMVNDYLDLLEGMRLHESDLPDGAAQRFVNGEATHEDFEAVRQTIKSRTGVDPGDLSSDPRLLQVVGKPREREEDDPSSHYIEPPDFRYL